MFFIKLYKKEKRFWNELWINIRRRIGVNARKFSNLTKVKPRSTQDKAERLSKRFSVRISFKDTIPTLWKVNSLAVPTLFILIHQTTCFILPPVECGKLYYHKNLWVTLQIVRHFTFETSGGIRVSRQ
jgi:hypothetical protein